MQRPYKLTLGGERGNRSVKTVATRLIASLLVKLKSD